MFLIFILAKKKFEIFTVHLVALLEPWIYNVYAFDETTRNFIDFLITKRLSIDDIRSIKAGSDGTP